MVTGEELIQLEVVASYCGTKKTKKKKKKIRESPTLLYSKYIANSSPITKPKAAITNLLLLFSNHNAKLLAEPS